MEFKQLHFQRTPDILEHHEEAHIGCLTVHIWKRGGRVDSPEALRVTLSAGISQLDETNVIISEFESLEDAQEHAECVAQQMVEKYIQETFLEG